MSKSKREYKDFIVDVVKACSDISDFIKNMSYEDFVSDQKTVYAVVKAIEIIGEASKLIPEKIRLKYPHVEWKKAIGMRDKLVHDYFGIDYEVLWNTIQINIPKLAKEFKSIADNEIK